MEVALGARETMRGEVRVDGITENSSRESCGIAAMAFGLSGCCVGWQPALPSASIKYCEWAVD
jgi:hypothetical protein